MVYKHKHPDIHYITHGEGVPVILIHGMAASHYDWERLLPALVEAGFQTYALDLPGHGDSAKPDDPEYYHIDNLYALFAEWIDRLGLEQAPLLVGHSLGAYLSLKYALHHPQKVRAQVLIDPFYSPMQLSSWLRALQRKPRLGEKALRIVPFKFLHTLMSWEPFTETEISAQARQQIALDLKRASPHIVYIPRTISDLTPELEKIHTPSLVIWGDKDSTLKPDSFASLVSSLPGAVGNQVSNCGHQPHLGRPEIVSQSVLDFLKNPVTAHPGREIGRG